MQYLIFTARTGGQKISGTYGRRKKPVDAASANAIFIKQFKEMILPAMLLAPSISILAGSILKAEKDRYTASEQVH